VNAKTDQGFTALLFASRGGNKEMVKLLKDAGAVD
jgi:ankyrin repeat protein